MRLLRMERLGAWARSWDELSGSAPLPTPFMRSWWVDHAAEGDPAILLCVDDDGGLAGGAAFEVDRVGRGAASVERVRCLGQGTLAPDHLDVLSAPGRRREVLGAVGRWLTRGDRVIDLDGLSEACELPHLLGATELARVPAPYLTLSGDDPVAALPGRLRSTVTRSTRRLAKAGYHATIVEPSRAGEALDTLLRLHDDRWSEDSGFSGGWSRFRAAAVAGMAAGEVVVHELADDSGTVIATELEMVAGRRVAFYQAGRLTDHDYRGSGSALKGEVLRWASGRGFTEFDLLRGDEPYKHEWATGTRHVVRARTGVGPRGRAVAAAANLWWDRAPQVMGALGRLRGRGDATPSGG